MSAEAARLGNAMVGGAHKAFKHREKPMRYAVVTATDPGYTYDLTGADIILEEDEVTFSAAVQKYIDEVHGLKEGDALAVVKDHAGEYLAIDVVPKKAHRLVVPRVQVTKSGQGIGDSWEIIVFDDKSYERKVGGDDIWKDGASAIIVPKGRKGLWSFGATAKWEFGEGVRYGLRLLVNGDPVAYASSVITQEKDPEVGVLHSNPESVYTDVDQPDTMIQKSDWETPTEPAGPVGQTVMWEDELDVDDELEVEAKTSCRDGGKFNVDVRFAAHRVSR